MRSKIIQEILDKETRVYTHNMMKEIIKDSYNDYLSVCNKHKEMMAKQIAFTAEGFIKNAGGKIEDWLEVFAKEEIVVSKLKQIK